MKPAFAALALVLLLGGCVTDSGPRYSLGGGETGVFSSANPGRPIPLERIKGMDEQQLATTFGAPVLDRKDGPARVLRYQSDACTLFVSLYGTSGAAPRASFADAYDLHLRPLPVDACAGSVAAQKRRIA
jgi:hypothetical protein